MNKIIINPVLQTNDNKDCKSQGYYFTLTQVKIKGAIQFYEHMGINYVKNDRFKTFNIFIYQSHKFLYNDSSLRQLNNNFN